MRVKTGYSLRRGYSLCIASVEAVSMGCLREEESSLGQYTVSEEQPGAR